MNIPLLPTLNALLNATAAALLLAGRIRIKRDDRDGHRRLMMAALAVSALFLISYVIYHYMVGSVPYPYHDWTRPIYFIILVPHIILAAVMVPFVLAAVWFALTNRFSSHVRLVKWVWPVWIFVSITGVLIYLMLYVR